MDIENATNITNTSFDFITSASKTKDAYLPVSSLPYPKEVISTAIKQYLAGSKLSKEEHQTIQTKYRLLANFLDDEKAQFMNMIDNSLKQIDIKNNDACKAWTQDPKNNEAYKKYTTILSEIDAERKKLREELVLKPIERKIN